jgi:hypothetical protein
MSTFPLIIGSHWKQVTSAPPQPNPVADDLKRPIVSQLLRQNADQRLQLAERDETIRQLRAQLSSSVTPAPVLP